MFIIATTIYSLLVPSKLGYAIVETQYEQPAKMKKKNIYKALIMIVLGDLKLVHSSGTWIYVFHVLLSKGNCLLNLSRFSPSSRYVYCILGIRVQSCELSGQTAGCRMSQISLLTSIDNFLLCILIALTRC